MNTIAGTLRAVSGRVICVFYGHRRGKLVAATKVNDGRTLRVFSCPRCGHETRYKKTEVSNDIQ